MNVICAKHSGFCTGVKSAVDTAVAVGKGAYILGEIVHNSQVVNELSQLGLITVDNLEEVPCGATLIFRSHGVPKSFYSVCEEKNIKVVDCTCHFVRKTQKIVEEQHNLKKSIIIVGEPNHPEVVGLQGWCENSAIVIKSSEEIKTALSKILCKNIAVVCQTTFSEQKFVEIIKNIKKVCEKTVEVFNSICYTTIRRQKEVESLSKECDAILVVGGLNSSNTNKLFELATKNCKNVFRLADAENFNYEKLNNYLNVGIVSGASTPNKQTQEVLLKMAENTEVKATESTMADVVAKIDNESKFKKGQIVQATISKATEEGLEILLPFSKKEYSLNKNEIECEEYNPADFADKIGETLDLLVVELKPSLKLSQKMIKAVQEEEALSAEIEAGKEFQVVCTGANKGGLVAQMGTYSVFVPAKEIRPGFVKDLSKYEGKTLRLRAIEIKKDARRKEIIASQRVILQEEREARDAAKFETEEAFFSNISVGDIVEGKVERITGFGAFVSVNGFDCLAHISDLSWTGIDQVSDILEIGNTYSFKVLKIDRENKKVSIGFKQLQAQPWDLVQDKYQVGDVVHGRVVRIVPFGAFVEVERGIDGLVHVSQISHERVDTPASVLSVGEEVDAKIVAIDPEARKMNLSIRALLPEQERRPRREYSDDQQPSGNRRGGRFSRRNDDEYSNWSEGSISVGTSIADMIESNKNK